MREMGYTDEQIRAASPEEKRFWTGHFLGVVHGSLGGELLQLCS